MPSWLAMVCCRTRVISDGGVRARVGASTTTRSTTGSGRTSTPARSTTGSGSAGTGAPAATGTTTAPAQSPNCRAETCATDFF